MVDLRELLARAICEYDEERPGSCGCGGVCSNTHAIGQADAILAALDASGLVVIPREPTIPMVRVIVRNMTPDAAKYWPMVLSASPYAKKEVE